MVSQKINWTIYRFFVLLGFFLPSSVFASGASLYFSPSAVSCAPGVTFVVDVYVTSSETAVNAIEGDILFSADKLSVSSLDKNGSAINLWVQEPSSGSGRVSFKGIILNPGFIGAGGKLISIHFKADNAGDGTVRFASASVLANDGKGTKVPVSLSGMKVAINASAPEASASPANPEPSSPVNSAPASPAPVKPKPVPAGEMPPAPVIRSSTHPDPQSWYHENDARLFWVLPEGVTAISFLLDDKVDSIPGNYPDKLADSEEFHDLDDGTKYFHLKFKNASGWGATAHFRLNIDMENPVINTFKIRGGEASFNEGVEASFGASDDLSGIDRFGFVIDGGSEITLAANQTAPYILPPLVSGKHGAVLTAYDRAGNSVSFSQDFEIGPFAQPVIENYLTDSRGGKFLVVRGNTYPDAVAVVWLKRDGEDFVSYEVQSDSSGNFIFMSKDEMKDGSYVLKAEAVSKSGLRTAMTSEIAFRVEKEAYSSGSDWKYPVLLMVFACIAFALGFVCSARGSRKNKYGYGSKNALGQRITGGSRWFAAADILRAIRIRIKELSIGSDRNPAAFGVSRPATGIRGAVYIGSRKTKKTVMRKSPAIKSRQLTGAGGKNMLVKTRKKFGG